MRTTAPKLLATCWTHAGSAAPDHEDPRSSFNLLDRIAAVGEAGWEGIGIVRGDLLRARDEVGYDAVRTAVAAAGITRIEIELLLDWWTTGDKRELSDESRADLLEAAGALGARMIKVSPQLFDVDVDVDVMAEEFDRLSSQAAERGARIALEPLPFSNFATYQMASEFVHRVGNPNGGLVLDVWHLFRAGNVPADLPHIVRPEQIFGIELNDAVDPAPEDLWNDTLTQRRLPGEGSWDLAGFINEIRGLGYDDYWGVEILSDEHRLKPLERQVSDAFRATRHVFELADAARDETATRP